MRRHEDFDVVAVLKAIAGDAANVLEGVGLAIGAGLGFFAWWFRTCS